MRVKARILTGIILFIKLTGTFSFEYPIIEHFFILSISCRGIFVIHLVFQSIHVMLSVMKRLRCPRAHENKLLLNVLIAKDLDLHYT